MSAALDYRLDVFGELAQFTGTVRTYNVDKELRSVMKEDAHRAIGDEARERGGWSNIRDCGEYRRPGPSSLDPNTKQGKRTLRKVNKLSGVILARRGKQPQPSAGVQKRAPRQTAGARRRQPSGPHANHLSKAQAVMKLRAASGGQNAPTGASRRKPRAASGGQNAPTGASCRKPRLRAGAPGSGADAGESDEDSSLVPVLVQTIDVSDGGQSGMRRWYGRHGLCSQENVEGAPAGSLCGGGMGP